MPAYRDVALAGTLGVRWAMAALGLLVPLLTVAAARGREAPTTSAAPATRPSTRPTEPFAYGMTRPSPDGTGRVYMGREIAQVMGHLGAGWLERPGRDQEEQPRKAIALIGLRPTDVVADIGAGSGYFSFRMAPLVPQGKVLAVDIQPEMLAFIKRTAKAKGIDNVEPVLGKVDDPHLPEGAVDVVLMVDAYHEFDHPREMMEAIVKALKPRGRVIDLEYRAEDPKVEIKPHHKMSQAQAIKEMQAVGLRHVRTIEDLPQQHFMIFEKPAGGADTGK